MAVFRAVIGKCGTPDRFELTGVGRSMTTLVSDAFLEQRAEVAGRLEPGITPDDLILAFVKGGWKVQILTVLQNGTGEGMLREFARRHSEPPPPPADDLD